MNICQSLSAFTLTESKCTSLELKYFSCWDMYFTSKLFITWLIVFIHFNIRGQRHTLGNVRGEDKVKVGQRLRLLFRLDMPYFVYLFIYLFICFLFFIVIQLQLYAFSPHPSTPPCSFIYLFIFIHYIPGAMLNTGSRNAFQQEHSFVPLLKGKYYT